MFGLDSKSSVGSGKVLVKNVFGSREKLKRKEYDIREDKKLERDTKELFASVQPQKASGY